MTANDSLVKVTIDGKDVEVPAGTLITHAAEKIGVRIPRFCDHPLLKPAGACRQCLVEVACPGRDGVVAKDPKLVPFCVEAVTLGMGVYTQHTSEVAVKAQRGTIEFLLVNHLLDCPICDKGGECPLQNQALSDGHTESRFVDVKRAYPKPVQVTPQILLDRDRYILCQRCTRSQPQIAGDPFTALQGRGGGSPDFEVHSLNGSQTGGFDARVLNFSDSDGGYAEPAPGDYVGSYGNYGPAEGFIAGPMEPAETDRSGRPFSSYFSGNIIQICPVGAFTSPAYRFRSRPFDLVSVPGVTEHDASGSAIRVNYQRDEVLCRLAWEDPEVSEDRVTDKDRFAFKWQNGPDRLTHPLVRDASGELAATLWENALDVATRGLAVTKAHGGVGVLAGGRLTMGDACAYPKFARTVLDINDIDFRTRPTSPEEDAFLGFVVTGSGRDVTCGDLEKTGHILAVDFEAEEERGSVFLRLRKAVLVKATSVSVAAPYATARSVKMNANFIPAVPETEATIPDGLDAGDPVYDGLADDGIILVGEHAAELEGALSAARRFADRSGARLAWIPRRVGDRGAMEMGMIGGLLPGGHPVAGPQARAEVEEAWGAKIPSMPGRSAESIPLSVHSGTLGGLPLGGVEVSDLPGDATPSIESAGFVVQLRVRTTTTTALADVVLSVAPSVEEGGSFANWEGRIRPFGQALMSVERPDRIVLNDLVAESGVDLGLDTLADAAAQTHGFKPWNGPRMVPPHAFPEGEAEPPAPGVAVLASRNLFIGEGVLFSNEPYLAGAARRPTVVMSEATARTAGVAPGGRVIVQGTIGRVTFPVVTLPMPDGVVWIPQNSAGCKVASLGVRPGDAVTVAAEVSK